MSAVEGAAGSRLKKTGWSVAIFRVFFRKSGIGRPQPKWQKGGLYDDIKRIKEHGEEG